MESKQTEHVAKPNQPKGIHGPVICPHCHSKNPSTRTQCRICHADIYVYATEEDAKEQDWDPELLKAKKQMGIIQGMMGFSLVFSLLMLFAIGVIHYQDPSKVIVQPIQLAQIQSYQSISFFNFDVPLFIPIIANPIWIFAMLIGLTYIRIHPYKCLLLVLVLLSIHTLTSIILLPMGYIAGMGGLVFFIICAANLKPAYYLEKNDAHL